MTCRILAFAPAIFLVACQNPSDPTFALSLTFSNLPDGGTAVTDSGALLYQPGGPFTARVTATVSSPTLVNSTTPPTHATLLIDEPSLPTNATASTTVALLAQDGGLFS